MLEIYPDSQQVEEDIPEAAKSYLEQAIASIHAPAGAVMLAASTVDAMLKEKNYKEGSLYERIERAVKDKLITSEMAQWHTMYALMLMINVMQMKKLLCQIMTMHSVLLIL